MNDGTSSLERKRAKGIRRQIHVASDTLMEKQMISLSELQNEAIHFPGPFSLTFLSLQPPPPRPPNAH